MDLMRRNNTTFSVSFKRGAKAWVKGTGRRAPWNVNESRALRSK